jgi:hypothetical protein
MGSERSGGKYDRVGGGLIIHDDNIRQSNVSTVADAAGESEQLARGHRGRRADLGHFDAGG